MVELGLLSVSAVNPAHRHMLGSLDGWVTFRVSHLLGDLDVLPHASLMAQI